MKHVLKILDQLEAEPSTNGKKEIIRANQNSIIFTRVLKMALDQGVAYNFTDLYENEFSKSMMNDNDILNVLKKFSERRGITEEEILSFSRMIPDDYTGEVVRRIIRKDLRCGVGAALVNSVIPGLIFSVSYQRYKQPKFIDKIDFSNRVVAQLKLDGMFVYLNTKTFRFTTRNGNSFKLGSDFEDRLRDSWALKLWGGQAVLMGELLVRDGGSGYLPRKEGNGIINSFIAGRGNPSALKDIVMITWGFVPEEDWYRGSSQISYKDILNMMYDVYDDGDPFQPIEMLETVRVESMEDAQAFFLERRRRKEEGAMIKDCDNLKWEDNKSGSKYGVKLKPIAEAEFEIVDAYPGKEGKKFENYLGGLVIKSSDGKILTKVGMGFSDEDREKGVEWWKLRKGMVISCKFTGVAHDKTDRETFCLDHTRFVELRSDKTTADTYEYCLNELSGS